MEPLREKRVCCQQTRLRNAISNFSNAKIVNRIIATGVDINHQFFINSSDKSQLSTYSTPLHLAATKSDIANFQILLDHGANVAITDSEGLTALHRIVNDCLSNNDKDELPNSSFINSALSAHIKLNELSNPADSYGFTHFHVACMMNNTDVVKFFLNNGVNVNHPVGHNALQFAGFTPLHFSAKFLSFETAEILVQNGADINLQNAKGMTTMHLLIERKIAMLELIEVTESVEALLEKINSNEKITKLLLDSNITDYHIKDNIGMSKYHTICTLQQQSALTEKLLEQCNDIHAQINLNSNIWSGYTMLHFAAHCNVQTMKLLLVKGANIEAKDSAGSTPFDIYIKRCKLENLHAIMSMIPSWTNIYFSDGKTKLLDCIASMKRVDEFESFVKNNVNDVNICLSKTSPLWPGSSFLHLSVILANHFVARDKGVKFTATHRFSNIAEINIVKACLNLGVSVSSQDAHGRTALHLAFYSGKWRIIDILLQSHRHKRHNWNIIDDSSLSLLHIACVVKNIWIIEEWLTNNSDVNVNVVYRGNISLPNVKPGWTPLHVAIYSNTDVQIAQMLLDHGADPHLADKKGLTPIHLLLVSPQISSSLSNLLLSLVDLKESKIENPAFTRLHVASYFDNTKAIDKLLDFGADINAISSLPHFENCTPLHLAMMNKSMAAVDILIRRGADVRAKGSNNWTLLSKGLSNKKYGRSLKTFIVALRANETLRQRAKMELGLTLLHVVCRAGHVDSMADLLSKGADVNDRIRDDSPFWPGWTPLHVLVTMGIEIACQEKKKKQNNFKIMLKMLLEHGSQVDIRNADGDTALHLMLKKNPCHIGYFIIHSLLTYRKDFSVNPINKDGVTHFHAACLANNLEATERFLMHDKSCVNQTIKCSAHHYGGSTPLHLALNTNSKRHFGLENQLKMLDLLLKYNADLKAEDDHGYTPLHVAADCDPSCVPLLQKLIENGADINAQTIDGLTAFEMILRLKEVTVNEIEFFVDRQYRINGCNQMTDKGYLSIILNERNFVQRNEILKALMSAPNLMIIDDMGRTAIHNIVSTDDLVICEHDYIDLIDKLIKLGCDVNEQDKSGMTALHLAMLFRNENAITALLISGIDINIIDYNGKTAFSYIFDPCTRCLARCDSIHDYIMQELAIYVAKLQHFQLYVSESNENLKQRALENRWIKIGNMTSRIRENNKEAKSIVIGPRGWTLQDFLTEHVAVKEYHRLIQSDQTLIDQFFGEIDYHCFHDLKYILKVQYRHAVQRGSLIQRAVALIRSLFGLPDLCAEEILWYLRNPDMKHLIIAASSIHADFK